MGRHDDFFKGLGVGAILYFVFFVIGVSWGHVEYKKMAVGRGYAQYCPLTGDWAWKGECK